MRILHYSLGFPPYRSGGLTKFCMDLMHQQMKMGHYVALLWPGQISFIRKVTRIRNDKVREGIGSFEIINPLPVSYDEGIIDIAVFTARGNKTVYLNFLRKFKPDVIHVHTLMGLHKEFLEAAKEVGIRTVFSIHDFFAICPKVTLFREGKICDSAEDCENCPECNLTALSMKKMIFLQMPLYRMMKNSPIVKKLRQRHRGQYLGGEADAAGGRTTRNTASDYRRLRGYYSSMVALFDKIHANSVVTRDVFIRYFDCEDIEVIHITHSNIKDNRRKKEYLSDRLRLAYLGNMGGAKGFFFLGLPLMNCG